MIWVWTTVTTQVAPWKLIEFLTRKANRRARKERAKISRRARRKGNTILEKEKVPGSKVHQTGSLAKNSHNGLDIMLVKAVVVHPIFGMVRAKAKVANAKTKKKAGSMVHVTSVASMVTKQRHVVCAMLQKVVQVVRMILLNSILKHLRRVKARKTTCSRKVNRVVSFPIPIASSSMVYSNELQPETFFDVSDDTFESCGALICQDMFPDIVGCCFWNLQLQPRLQLPCNTAQQDSCFQFIIQLRLQAFIFHECTIQTHDLRQQWTLLVKLWPTHNCRKKTHGSILVLWFIRSNKLTICLKSIWVLYLLQQHQWLLLQNIW